MEIPSNIRKLNITEEIINHFFSKTKLSEHSIESVSLFKKTDSFILIKAYLELNSRQPKRREMTIQINLDSLRDYKLNKLFND